MYFENHPTLQIPYEEPSLGLQDVSKGSSSLSQIGGSSKEKGKQIEQKEQEEGSSSKVIPQHGRMSHKVILLPLSMFHFLILTT